MTTLNLDLTKRITQSENESDNLTISIGDSQNPYPIPYHSSFEIIDSTKVKAYKACPRRYFYEYLFGWLKKGSLHHVNFGSAIHSGLYELNLWRKANSGVSAIANIDYLLPIMMAAFLIEYRKEHPPIMDSDFAPKNPSGAESIFTSYIMEFDHLDREEKILFPETGGRILIDEGKYLTFKTDLISELPNGKIIVRDYKTGSRNTESWTSKFFTATQIGTYLHAAKCIFGDNLSHFDIRGIFVYKTNSRDRKWGNVDFQPVMVKKSNLQMEDWRLEAIYWYDRILEDMNKLKEVYTRDHFMNCFARNENTCESYGSACPYISFCPEWTNPVPMSSDIPMGFYTRRWNPLEDLQVEEMSL